jgi:hypothetical protein
MTLQLAYSTCFELKSQPLKEQSQFAKKGPIGLYGPSMRIIALPDAKLSIRAYGFLESSLWIAIKIKHNGNRPKTLQKYRNLRTRGRG